MSAQEPKLSWLVRLAILLGLTSKSHAMKTATAQREEKLQQEIEESVRRRLPEEVRDGEILPIVFYPSTTLRDVSRPVENFDDDLRELVKSMGATMYLCGGVGLSAIQVGVPLRVIVADMRPLDQQERSVFRVFINPTIISASEETEEDIEGCLSIPNVREKVSRPSVVRVSAFTEHGIPFEATLEGWPARIFLHEEEHLNGEVFLDHFKGLTRRMLDKRAAKLRRSIAIDEKIGVKRANHRASRGKGR